MSTRAKLAVAVAAILVTSACLAKDSGPPRIDIEKTCRSNTAALTTSLGGEIQSNFDSCMTGEKGALDQIIKDWAGYPALAKQRCIQPREYLPGYVEWLTCLEMTRDVLKQRKEQSAGNADDRSSSETVGSGTKRQSSKGRTRPERKDCPVVKIAEDGSIAWVDACPLGPPY
jgi:hypothetical protein